MVQLSGCLQVVLPWLQSILSSSRWPPQYICCRELFWVVVQRRQFQSVLQPLIFLLAASVQFLSLFFFSGRCRMFLLAAGYPQTLSASSIFLIVSGTYS